MGGAYSNSLAPAPRSDTEQWQRGKIVATTFITIGVVVSLFVVICGAVLCMCRMEQKHYKGLQCKEDWVPVIMLGMGTLSLLVFLVF